MLDPVLAATEGLDVTVAYTHTPRPFDASGLRALGGDTVILVEPYLAGTSARVSTTERTCWTVPASAPQGADAVTAGLSSLTGTAFGWAAVIPSRQSTRIIPITARQVIGRWCIWWVYWRRLNVPTACRLRRRAVCDAPSTVADLTFLNNRRGARRYGVAAMVTSRGRHDRRRQPPRGSRVLIAVVKDHAVLLLALAQRDDRVAPSVQPHPRAVAAEERIAVPGGSQGATAAPTHPINVYAHDGANMLTGAARRRAR